MNKYPLSRFPKNIEISPSIGEISIPRSNELHWDGTQLNFFSVEFKLNQLFLQAIVKNIPIDERIILKEIYSLNVDDISNDFLSFKNKLNEISILPKIRDELSNIEYPKILEYKKKRGLSGLFSINKKDVNLKSTQRFLFELITLCTPCIIENYDHEFKTCVTYFKQDYIKILVLFTCNECKFSAFQLSYLEQITRIFGLEETWILDTIKESLELNEEQRINDVLDLIKKWGFNDDVSKSILFKDIKIIELSQFENTRLNSNFKVYENFLDDNEIKILNEKTRKSLLDKYFVKNTEIILPQMPPKLMYEYLNFKKFKISNDVLISYLSKDKEVDIPNTITSIGKGGFWRCNDITQVIIPNSIILINQEAFSYCSSLTEITIPNSVTTIEQEAFSHCKNITTIIIPNSVTKLGNGVFLGCTNLTEIIIPNSVTSIGEWAFKGCNNLKQITIPLVLDISKCKIPPICQIVIQP